MGTRNAAIAQAVGTYAAFIDSDDQRKPTSLELQVAFLEQHPEVVAVGTGAEWCDEKMNRLNDRLYPLDDARIRRTFFRHSPFCLPSLMIRTSAFDTPAYDVALNRRGPRCGDAARDEGSTGQPAGCALPPADARAVGDQARPSEDGEEHVSHPSQSGPRRPAAAAAAAAAPPPPNRVPEFRSTSATTSSSSRRCTSCRPSFGSSFFNRLRASA